MFPSMPDKMIIGTADELNSGDTNDFPLYHRAGDVIKAINNINDVPELVRAHFKYIMELPADSDGVFIDSQGFAQKVQGLYKGSSEGEQDFIRKIADAIRQITHVPYVDLDGNDLFVDE